MGAKTSAFSNENANFFRLTKLLLDVGADILREVFKTYYASKTLDQYLSDPNIKNKIKNMYDPKKGKQKPILSQKQYDLLYPAASGKADVNNFDITLLSCLLRNLHDTIPPKDVVWSNPQTADTSIEADVCRIRENRNKLYAHVSSPELSVADYQSQKQELENLMVRMAGKLSPPSFLQDIKDKIYRILKDEIEPYHKKLKKELKQWHKQVETLQEKVDKIHENVQEVKDDVAGAKQEVEDMHGDVTDVKQKMIKVNETVDKVDEKMDKVDEKVDKLDEKVDKVDEKVDKVDEKVDKVDEKVDKVDEKVDKVDEKVDKVDEKMDKVDEKMDKVDEKVDKVDEKVDKVQDDVKDIHSKLDNIQGSKETDQERLRSNLMAMYEKHYTKIPISPLHKEEDTPIEALFTDVFMVVETKDKSETKEIPVESYQDIFYSKDGEVRSIYVLGQAGAGKTVYTKQIVNKWVKTQKQLQFGKVKLETKDEEVMAQYDFLFYVPLRSVEKSDTLLEVICKCVGDDELDRNTTKYVFKHCPEKILVIFDGLDEIDWFPSRHNLHSFTIVTTTRPWKYDTIKGRSPQKDRILQLRV